MGWIDVAKAKQLGIAVATMALVLALLVAGLRGNPWLVTLAVLGVPGLLGALAWRLHDLRRTEGAQATSRLTEIQETHRNEMAALVARLEEERATLLAREGNLERREADLAQARAYVGEWLPKVEAFQRWEQLPQRESTLQELEAVLTAREKALGELQEAIAATEDELARREARLDAQLEGLADDTFETNRLLIAARALLETMRQKGPNPDTDWPALRSLEEALRKEQGMSYGRRD